MINPSNKQKFGDGTASDKIIEANRGSATNPKVKWNESAAKWQFSNDGTTFSDFGGGGGSSVDLPNELTNLGLAASVGSNALTVALKQKDGTDASVGSPVKIAFRDVTATNGQYVQRTVTSALSVVVSSGSTLGHVSNSDQYVHVYAIDNSGTVELAVAGSRIFDEGSLQSSTAEGGAGAADDGLTLYSTTARTSKAIRYLGRVKSNQATAGTWASSPSEVSVFTSLQQKQERSECMFDTANGYGSTNTAIRKYTNLSQSGPDLTAANSSTLGASVTINKNGIYAISYEESDSAGNGNFGISINSTQLTTSVDSANGVRVRQFLVNGMSQLQTYIAVLNQGDVVRPHTDASPSGTSSRNYFRVIKIAD